MRERLTDIDYLLVTDGSVRRSRITGRSYSSYAGVLANLDEKLKTSYSGSLDGYQIDYCEAYAIYAGLGILMKAAGGRDIHVLAVSDSKLTVSALTCYIPYIWKTDEEVWKKTDGNPVKGQGLYKRIKRLLENNANIRVKVAHINSHLEIASQWPRMRKYMAKWGVINSEQSVKFIMRLNCDADALAAAVSKRSQKAEERGCAAIRLGGTGLII